MNVKSCRRFVEKEFWKRNIIPCGQSWLRLDKFFIGFKKTHIKNTLICN